jgi:hypothetical protein
MAHGPHRLLYRLVLRVAPLLYCLHLQGLRPHHLYALIRLLISPGRLLLFGFLILDLHNVQGILRLEGVVFLPRQTREGVRQGEGVVVLLDSYLNTTALWLVGEVQLSDGLLQLLAEVPLLVQFFFKCFDFLHMLL